MSKYVIGDIHGGLRALKQVIELTNPSFDDELIFLGDYVDGWSESSQVIDFLIDLSKKSKCVFIRGNHDTILNDYLTSGNISSSWLVHGGRATLANYKGLGEEVINMHIDFLERLQNYYIDDENRLFIHAGFTSMHGPVQELDPRYYYWDRSLWEMARCMDISIDENSPLFPKRLLLFHEIYIGHTPTSNYGLMKPMNFRNLWNVDTGAAFKGCLTMMNIETKEVFQSEPLPVLYPNETGRN
jgi:serine/threonine protein phosphatase 1